VVALHLGLATGRALLTLERLAVNLLDFDLPDNASLRLQDTPILPGAPLALATRLPLQAIKSAGPRPESRGSSAIALGFTCATR